MKERTEGREQPPVLGGAGGCADTSPLSLVPPCEGGELNKGKENLARISSPLDVLGGEMPPPKLGCSGSLHGF